MYLEGGGGCGNGGGKGIYKNGALLYYLKISWYKRYILFICKECSLNSVYKLKKILQEKGHYVQPYLTRLPPINPLTILTVLY